MARFTQKTATILAGQSLSGMVDCTQGAPIMLFLPAEWSPARISFLASPDGTNFFDLFDRDAQEVQFNVVPGTTILLAAEWVPISYFKIRSGARDLPVSQAAQRDIVVTVDSSA